MFGGALVCSLAYGIAHAKINAQDEYLLVNDTSAEHVHVTALATNGYDRLSYLDAVKKSG